MTMAVDGKAAEALGDLGRIRWQAATGEALPTARSGNDAWPEKLEPQFRHLDVGIARTRGKAGSLAEVREIEKLFLDMIAAARRHIYVEQQYFASRVIAEAITKRLAEPDGPEVVIVNPRTGEAWLDDKVMSSARSEIVRVMQGVAHPERFRIYYPVTEAGADIYVHAKLMIVDDIMIRVGSANMNNRSMGLDSECDVLIQSRVSTDPHAPARIAEIRCSLMAEHLGCPGEEVHRMFEETGSLIATIEQLRGGGRSLRPLKIEKPDKLGKAVARSEVADPESACDKFEPLAQHKLLGRLRRLRRRRSE
jgi:phosphatidylserine/phosphatidylglycerophosphate/cardiolipin synthase-like enzyme